MKRYLAVMAFLVVGAVPAWAHGNLSSSDPEAGSRVPEPPSVVRLDLVEPPTPESRFSVIDGCGDDVVADVGHNDTAVVLTLDSAQPGRWRVEYRTVSALDGHLVRGDFAFRVTGDRDCSEPSTPDPGSTEPEGNAAGADLTGDAVGETSPLIPMLAIGGGILALAVVIRKLMTR